MLARSRVTVLGTRSLHRPARPHCHRWRHPKHRHRQRHHLEGRPWPRTRTLISPSRDSAWPRSFLREPHSPWVHNMPAPAPVNDSRANQRLNSQSGSARSPSHAIRTRLLASVSPTALSSLLFQELSHSGLHQRAVGEDGRVLAAFAEAQFRAGYPLGKSLPVLRERHQGIVRTVNNKRRNGDSPLGAGKVRANAYVILRAGNSLAHPIETTEQHHLEQVHGVVIGHRLLQQIGKGDGPLYGRLQVSRCLVRLRKVPSDSDPARRSPVARSLAARPAVSHTMSIRLL